MKKYGIDTNVLVRYIVQDDPEQSVRAANFLERNCKIDNPGHISLIVLCEFVWVLGEAYNYSKEHIVSALLMILSTAEFSFESPGVAWQAFRQYKNGSADFADYIIGQLNKTHGCVATITFDKQAGKSSIFKLI